MRTRALGFVKCWPKGKRMRGSKMEGLSMINQAKGGGIVGPILDGCACHMGIERTLGQ